MQHDENEEKLLRSVALQNAKAVFRAREQAERQLVDANERIRSILESITDGFVAFDNEWRIIYINPRGAELVRPLHPSREELIGKNHWEAFPETVGTELEAHYRRAMREQVTVHFENFYPPLNAWFDIRAYPSPHGLSVYFQDITERKRAADALREQREWLAVTLRSIGDGVIATDTEQKVTFLNPVAEMMTGWKSDEAVGQPLSKVFKLINEQTRHPTEAPISVVFREGRIVGLANHTALVARNGTETAIEDSAAPILDSNGKIAGAVMVFHDVTERRRADIAIRESEERWRGVFNHAAVGIALASLDGRFIELNKKFAEILGYPPEELLTKTAGDITHPDDRPRTREHMTRLLKGEMPHYVMEKRYVRKDGAVVWSLTTVTVVKDESGKPQRFIGVIEDITSRKEAEQQLKSSGERLQVALAAGGLGAWEWEGATDLVTIGERTAEIFGLPHQPITWKRMRETLHPDDRERAQAAVERALADHTDYNVEYRVIHPSGNVVWVAARGRGRYAPNGEALGLTGVVADVTERKKAEEARSRLAAVVESSDDAIISMDFDARVTTWNKGAERTFGYTAEEIVGKSITILIPPSRENEEPALLERLKRGERIEHYETQRVRKDGRVLHVSLSVSPVYDANGSIVGVSKISRDITVRKQAEAERARLTGILERSLNEIYIFDTETLRFEYVNDGARRNLGFTMEQMRQKTPLDIKPEFTEPQFREMVKPLLAGEKEKHLFYTIHRRADGTDYPVEVHLQAVTHAERRVFLAVILDITERKKAEEKLRRSEEELRALANSIPQLAWMAEPDGHIFWYNRRWYEYTGTTFEQMEGWGWQSVHDPKILPQVVERWKESIRTGQPFDMEFPLRGADGVFRWFLTRVNPVRDSEGKITRWFGTNTDVDEVRRTREALHDAQEKLSRHAEDLEKQVAVRTASLREALSQLEEFSYSVSHDLRAPLRAIEGYSRLLREDYSDALPAGGHAFLDKISRSTERMQRLVNDVLTMSRVARAEMKLRPIQLQRFIEEITEQHPEMQAPAVDLSITTPHIVIADASSLNQAIANLLANAVKFVPEGTRPVVRVRSEQNADRVRIWVEDNGIGISAEHRSKLFGMFQRLPTKLPYEGTGIGLAIVRKAVERMGGTVGVESNAPTGSRFWVELKEQR